MKFPPARSVPCASNSSDSVLWWGYESDLASRVALMQEAEVFVLPSLVEGLSIALLEAMAASLSCRAAVKMHHRLRPEEAERLMSELFEAEHPWTCPHGRPVILKLSDRDLEKRFKRR